jgi:hypothetical protein
LVHEPSSRVKYRIEHRTIHELAWVIASYMPCYGLDFVEDEKGCLF